MNRQLQGNGKWCSGCAIFLHESEFWRCAAKPDGLQPRCKRCQRAAQRARANTASTKQKRREWMNANLERVRRSAREWARRNPDKAAKWRMENTDKFRAAEVKSRKILRDELSDSYIKRLLSKNGGGLPNLPHSLVEAKRVQLQIHRFIRSLRNDNNQ